jgi:hypothetical protein
LIHISLFAELSCSDDRWYVRAYTKNIMDDDSMVGMYASETSSGLLTDVFPAEPDCTD